jgi:citronellol/citronellal dehydrogenase
MTVAENRVAIITGASRGIGRAIALKLARHGIRIVAAAKTVTASQKSPGTIDETVAAAMALGSDALAVVTDVRDEAQLAELVAKTIARFGRIDIVVNNAGAIRWLPVQDLPVRRFDLMMDINARAPYALCHYAIPYLRKQGGHIVNLSPPLGGGDLATEQWSGRTAYLMSKYAMTHLTLGLAEELRPLKVAVNSLWPNCIIDTQATRVFADMFGAGAGSDWYSADLLADACYELVQLPPTNLSGRTLIAEEFMSKQGIKDLSRYRVESPV